MSLLTIYFRLVWIKIWSLLYWAKHRILYRRLKRSIELTAKKRWREMRELCYFFRMPFNLIDIRCQRTYLQSKYAIICKFKVKITTTKFSLKSFRINDEDTDCVAVSHGKMGGFISVPVIRNDTDCPDNAKNCYQAIEPLGNVICSGFGKTQTASKFELHRISLNSCLHSS